ncbi:MAG TPA: 3-methyl-2-oxobutanoate hydroxymethyltransferase [Candidatus Omnitrophota bacterium]|nr:3-methyl-2-oxobutanoate hydroxymethyltransferase [Candidatus Omnitrophota bacterium]HPD83855.1 3-methyl-2-oxobutanoate hydroxymethyltransferase [Candidatus Omnitrophota bacterium]HRZ02712.1 3-methyl-2-oxobutanoate hydroxymethyltransferase [Candidatus Omnitrophota bacterium]
MENQSRITIKEILEKKRKGEKITMLTAYDYSLATLIDKAGIDMILVGDSLANVVLGLESTREVGMAEMLHHTKAVNRAVKKALLVGDMPFGSYQKDTKTAVANARRFVDEAGCNAVKLEWFDGCLEVTEAIIKAGVAVMGHIGLTPQAVEDKKGFKVQGKDAESAKGLIAHAKELEKAGCFGIVLECVPDLVAQMVTKQLKIPTIGIGAGLFCDGQVLVAHDILGLFDRFRPKFAKEYINLNKLALEAIIRYRDEVVNGAFPDEAHSFTIKKEELERLK